MLSFQEKREFQRVIVEQNKVLSGAPSFTAKRQAQKAKTEALSKLGKISVKQPSGAENNVSIDAKQFVMPERAKAAGDKIVYVEAGSFDKAFAKDAGFYIGRNGVGNAIGDRYEQFKAFLSENNTIEVAEVGVTDSGDVSFTNGRHRYAVLRDMGMKKIPVAMDSESEMNAVKFGYVDGESGGDLPGDDQANDSEFGLQKGGIKTREKINSAVADIVAQIQAGKDPKTLNAEELALFKQYSGKGGLTDNSQYEYYTPTHVAEGVWDLLKENGFENGNVLEPSTGAGVFSATKSQGAVIVGAEIDPIAATVNQVLHPEDHIHNQSFEKLAVATPDNHFDAVIGNVPFGSARGAHAEDDPEYKSEKRIERYFINRIIDKTRPGGLIALVVPGQVIGQKQGAWKKWRAAISRKAEFLGGHKLPSKTFGKQGTDVVTDIIVLRKHPLDLLEKIDALPTDVLRQANVLWDEFIDGNYWLGEGKKFIKGQYVPADPNKKRSMEQVIAEEGMTNAALKQKLAIKFDSRIDWGVVDSAEPVINYYSAGDHRIINGKDFVFDGVSWSEVSYASGEGETPIDADKFGAETLEKLQAILESPESMLSINVKQAFAAYKKYPNLFNAQQKTAVEFAISQPLDKYREQAYRGSLIGSLVAGYIAKASAGNADDAERARLKKMLEDEHRLFGHPKSAKGFLLSGEMARFFGSYLKSVDEKGRVSSTITEGVEAAAGYEANNVLSIAEYLVKTRGGELTLDDVAGLYAGPRKLESLGDIADIDGIAFTPSGYVTTTQAYCSGEVYVKAAELQAVMENETDKRVKDKYQQQVDIMMAKVRRTSIDEISFGLRDKWLDRRYQIEFLDQSGYDFLYSVAKRVMKTSETGEEYEGVDIVTDETQSPDGTWKSVSYRKSDFERQLEHYMNGKSIGHNVRDKGSKTAEERTKDFRETVNALEEQFRYFMQSHPGFADIERVYNLTFNNYVQPDYDDSDLGLIETSGQIKPHWYQNMGVRLLSEQGTGILGFDVGLGKTASTLAFSAYDRQMGRSKKHLVVVPNSVLANWYQESKKFYGNHDNVMFVGFEPKRDKKGEILFEPVLDENGNPQVNDHTKEIEYQDILEKDSPETVYEKMHQIPHTNKAVVIMTEEKYKTIPLREETRLKFADEWASKSMMSNADAKKAAQQGKSGKSYQEAVSEESARGRFAAGGGKKKGELPYFEDMGFDRVIVDEAHRFRNSFQIQDGDTAKLAYLPNPAISQRATDMAMKSAYLREKYNGKGTILLTATPVANSPIEIFNMLSLVIDSSEFERYGIYTPDDFVKQFGKIDLVEKPTIRGEIVNREGLAGFKNLNALRGLFHRYALMRGPQDVDPNGDKMKLPEAVEMIDQMPMDGEQVDLYADLRLEAKEASVPGAKGVRSLFAIIRDMDRVTTDIDLYNKTVTFLFKASDESKVAALIGDLPEKVTIKLLDEDSGEKVSYDIKKTTSYSNNGKTLIYVAPEDYEEPVVTRLKKFKIEYVNHPLRPKYAKMIKNMQAELDSKGKQLVFTEEKSQHGKLVRLIVNHLPVSESQVAIINADTAAGEKLQEIADAYNRGEVRIVIANKKAEVGVNLQKGTSAIHHLTLPWNPASLQQRNGRGVRQGNKMAQVRVYYYQAKGSFDEYRLDLLKNKGNWIASLMDRNNGQDMADNAEAMGAIEQAALLSDNREDFIKMMEEQRAKKQAEEKAKKDHSAKIKLSNLASIELWLNAFDSGLEKAKQDAEKEIERAEARFAKSKDEGADDDLMERRERDIAIARNRAARVDQQWSEKRDQMQAQKRQIQAFLKGTASKGELPYDVSAVDNPLSAVLTKAGLLIAKGKTYKLERGDIVRVTHVDFTDKQVQIEGLVGYAYRSGADFGIESMFKGAVEVNYTPSELERMQWLGKQHTYLEIGEVSKDVFLENLDIIANQLRGYGLFKNDQGALMLGTSSDRYRNQLIYPDKNDKALRDELVDLYKEKMLKGTVNNSAFGYVMPVFFGEVWRESLQGMMKTADKEAIRAKASELITEQLKQKPMTTAAELSNVIHRMAGNYNTVESVVLAEVVEWMRANEYVNIADVTSIVNDAIDAEESRLKNKQAEMKAEEERVQNEALKSHPDYKEVPAELAAQFEALGVSVFFNTEEVITDGRGRFRNATYKPFERIWMKDRQGKNGAVFGVKEILKNRFKAQFCGNVIQGAYKYGNSTWHIPGDSSLSDLYELLS